MLFFGQGLVIPAWIALPMAALIATGLHAAAVVWD
jgi:hypothetical protein